MSMCTTTLHASPPGPDVLTARNEFIFSNTLQTGMDRSIVYEEDGTVSRGAAWAALPHTNLKC
jgi:hypothetical protein